MSHRVLKRLWDEAVQPWNEYQKELLRGILRNSCSGKCKIHQKTHAMVPHVQTKNVSITIIFLRILRNSSEELFYRQPLGDCF